MFDFPFLAMHCVLQTHQADFFCVGFGWFVFWFFFFFFWGMQGVFVGERGFFFFFIWSVFFFWGGVVGCVWAGPVWFVGEGVVFFF